ncbi:GerAB/ArcD/ProY family transporter [Bacillus benzoevorans]|uniref:Spore germination protein KB n=1 Tax=Bacillus benzoevorans TaxID=1456 RepID=A0A7X0LY42_9BACI|nr:GerAB/ArcD/ProY family transporter [Bacillus benzoevorans]MBB6447117.1 spore germination protein KB [Bacillus benzoevorans]
MEKVKISVTQLFILMFMFEIGTSLVINYGIEAKKDAWLAILLGMFGGVCLFFINYYLFRQYPTLPLTGYVRIIFGKYLGWLIGLLYILFFLYNSAHNIRISAELLLSSILPETPILAIIILMVLLICYVLYLGIEVLARTAEVFIVVLIAIGLLGNLFVFLSGNVDLTNLQPFLENGWKPIFKTTFSFTLMQPFAQMFAFSMILPYLNRPESAKRAGVTAIIASGLVLSYTISLDIAVLGIEEVERSPFPLLSTVGKVNIMEFIQRLDAIAVFTLLITVFFKASIFVYGAVVGIVDLFKLKNHQSILLPTGLIIVFLSMVWASDSAEVRQESLLAIKYILGFYLIVLPFPMLLIAMIRNRMKKKAS